MFVLPTLPYAENALEPIIGAVTMQTHHGKHHKAYVDTLNTLLKDAGASDASLEAVVRRADGKLFNNAAQAWNHTFFWVCMSPQRQAPDGELAAAIERDLGGLDKLKADFVAKGVGHFGSGWVWLAAKRDGTLVIVDSHDGENLLSVDGVLPLLVCDLWEHAYYLDHKNDREGFLKAWFDALPNWKFAADQYNAAKSGEKGWQHP